MYGHVPPTKGMYELLVPVDGSEERTEAQAEALVGPPCAADAVVVGCRRRPPVGTVAFDSVAREVIRQAERPIVVASQ